MIDGKERFFLKKSEVVETFANWPKEVDRMLYASRNNEPWLKIVSNEGGKSGAEVRVTAESVICAAHRLTNGERPPLMPSEKRKAVSDPQGRVSGGIPDRVVSALLRAGEILPAEVKCVEFNQDRKSIWVSWSNGDVQSIRKKSSRGRNTRVITICFSKPDNAKHGLSLKSNPEDRPD